MRLVVISGRSGSGKTTALQLLEDASFTCIDNLPIGLLPALMAQMAQSGEESSSFAIGVDARNLGHDLSRFPEIIKSSKENTSECTIVYLDASSDVLTKRFSETRRKHPLTNQTTGLQDAIAQEQNILKPISSMADITLDTSNLTLHELRSVIRKQVVGSKTEGTAITFESFGFKFGVPSSADFIFDVRCLPNPFWVPALRSQTGLEKGVVAFLEAQSEVEAMLIDITKFLETWIPSFQENNRSYMTIAIGWTGGMHRSVYIADKLSKWFEKSHANVQSYHRQLEK